MRRVRDKKKIAMIIAVAVFCLWTIMVIAGKENINVRAANKTFTIVIDPGHGGVDGGAEANDGTPEKNINLEIAMMLKKLIETEGHKAIMTREEDTGLYSDEAGAIHSKKVQDLKNRKEIVDNSKADLAVSIHLNSFTADRSVCGAQTFYGGESEDSKKLAEAIQESIGNRRKAMEKSNVLLLKQVKIPTVIVECGFLSNSKEAEKLKTLEYQNKVAKDIYKGIKTYLTH